MRYQRIGIVMLTDTGYMRDVLVGIRQFVRETSQRWIFAMSPHERPDVDGLAQWKPRGIIAFLRNGGTASKLAELGVPIINVGYVLDQPSLPHCGHDNEVIGRCAAQHFQERGFARFAFVGWEGLFYSVARKLAFCAALRTAGRDCEVFEGSFGTSLHRYTGSSSEHAQLCDWLARLEPPVGLLACNDVRASHVLRACQEAQITVPEQIAVLGIGNDESWCSMTHPPLSSVAFGGQSIGYLAARELARAMAGRRPRMTTSVPPLKIVVRQSSDILAIGDPVMAAALHYIREHADQVIGIDDVLTTVPVSRRTLERLFRKTLGCSLASEIRRVHVRRALDLIAATELSTEDVARMSGFSGYKHMWSAVRKATGLTPVEYRHSLRFPLLPKNS
jgi:LacI family transcriptional regulator